MQPANISMLETERLSLKEFSLNDADFILALVNSEGWKRYIGDRQINDQGKAKSYLENGPLKSYRDWGFGLWKVELKENGIPIGMCGLLKREHLNEPDIGFAFLPEFTGKGFAYESAAAVLQLAHQSYRLEKLNAIVVPDNTISVNLLKKLGFRFVKQFSFPNEQEVLCLYQWDI